MRVAIGVPLGIAFAAAAALSPSGRELAAPDGAQPPPITVDEAAACLGLSASQMDDVRAGKIVSTDFRELTDTQLAITVAMLVDKPIGQVADAVRDSQLFKTDPTVVKFKALGDKEPTDADFAEVAFASDESSEIKKLLGASPGSEQNLSAAEIAKFATLRGKFSGACDKDPACPDAVVGEYRSALLERMRAYRAGGMSAIAPYARSGGKTFDVGAELTIALNGCETVEKRFAEAIQAFRQYPKHPLEHVDSRFFWIKQEVQGRPDFALVHGMIYQMSDAFFGVERQFYVGHSYNGLVVMSGCLPTGDKTLVFYINRTSTDQVAGFAKDTRHALGRKHMRAEILASLEAIRAKLQRKS